MKRKLIMILSVLCFVSITACSKSPASSQIVTEATESSQIEESSTSSPTEPEVNLETESATEPETPSAEPESSAEPEISPAVSIEGLGDNLNDPIKVALNDEVYTFPGSTFADFEANGWVIDSGSEGAALAANYSTSVTYTKGDVTINLSAANNGEAALPINECECWALVYKSSNLDFSFPGGITNGSTPEEIEAAYGAPDSFYDTSEGVRGSMEYKFNNCKVKFQFYKGGLSAFDIRS